MRTSDHITRLPCAMITMSPTARDASRSGGATSSIPSMAFLLVHMDDSDSDLCAIRTVGVNFSTRIVIGWDWTKAKVNRLLHHTPPRTNTTYEYTCRVPYEIVEIIIDIVRHTYDLGTLKACSLTCRSWYNVAVLHLHHTLTLQHGKSTSRTRKGLKPLSKLHELGLTPLVKKIRVLQWNHDTVSNWFTPEGFSRLDLRHFSAFTNVHTLCLQQVDISCFIPGIERYFEHFSPTLRSITIYLPRCTPQQLPYFISLFPNLDDVEIVAPSFDTTTPDTKLAPFSAPKLQGRLRLGNFHRVEPWTYLVTSCGGLRFRYMDLSDSAGCTPTLFEACAETLETLRFHVTLLIHGEYGLYSK